MNKKNISIITAWQKGMRVTPSGSVIGVSGRQIKLFSSKKGYFHFSVKIEGNIRSTVRVMWLQAYQKYGNKIFDENIFVRHKDNDKHNDSWDNILIGTQSENMNDCPKEDRLKRARHASSFKRVLTDSEVIQIREMRSKGATYKKIGEIFGVGKSTLSYLFNKSHY